MEMVERRYEYLSPPELEKRRAEAAIAYLPVGSLEWHGRHLPVGLDAVKAHGICLRAAEQSGGVVLPPFFYGLGGGHYDYDWTVMVPLEQTRAVEDLLVHTLARLEQCGFEKMVLLTGHYPGEQMDLVREAARRHNDTGGPGRALGTFDYELGLGLLEREHAALYETSIMAALDPKVVHLEHLPDIQEVPLDESRGWDADRADPDNPLYGIFGTDPRRFDPQVAQQVCERVVADLVAKVQAL